MELRMCGNVGWPSMWCWLAGILSRTHKIPRISERQFRYFLANLGSSLAAAISIQSAKFWMPICRKIMGVKYLQNAKIFYQGSLLSILTMWVTKYSVLFFQCHLINGMLRHGLWRRITMAQIISHPWFVINLPIDIRIDDGTSTMSQTSRCRAWTM
jgi:hypothetical protein